MTPSTQLLVVDALDEFSPLPADAITPEPRQVQVDLASVRARLKAWEKDYEAAQASATLRGVRADWNRFIEWCQAAQCQPLPTTTNDLMQFLNDMAVMGRKRSTLNRYVFTIRLINHAAELPDPTKASDWKLRWKGLTKRLSAAGKNAPKQTAELKSTAVEEILNRLGSSLHDLRDAALLSLASDTLAREAELAAVTLENLERAEDGHATLFIPRSKTDQQGLGMFRYVSPETWRRIQMWCQAAQIESGYVFLPIGGRPKSTSLGIPRPKHLEPVQIARIFRRRAKQVGLPNADRITGHSARVGSAIELIESGASITEAQYAGGWKSGRMVLHYAQKASAGTNAMARMRRNRTKDRA